jgi:hypothetical protein
MSLCRLLVGSSRIPVARLGVICPKVCLSAIRLDLLLQIHDNTLFGYELLFGRFRHCLLVHTGKPGKRQHRMVKNIADAPVVSGCRRIVEHINLRLKPLTQLNKDVLGCGELVRARVLGDFVEDRLLRNLDKRPCMRAGRSGT